MFSQVSVCDVVMWRWRIADRAGKASCQLLQVQTCTCVALALFTSTTPGATI